MKVSKTLLQAMLVAVTTGMIVSCEKPKAGEDKKASTEQAKPGANTDGCPACGMG